jgi:uncharacterized membrane protein YvbJ
MWVNICTHTYTYSNCRKSKKKITKEAGKYGKPYLQEANKRIMSDFCTETMQGGKKWSDIQLWILKEKAHNLDLCTLKNYLLKMKEKDLRLRLRLSL